MHAVRIFIALLRPRNSTLSQNRLSIALSDRTVGACQASSPLLYSLDTFQYPTILIRALHMAYEEGRLFNKTVKILLQTLFVHGVVPNCERSSNQIGIHLQKDQKGLSSIATLMDILKTTPQNPNTTLIFWS